MGAVWLVRDRMLDRLVALKVLLLSAAPLVAAAGASVMAGALEAVWYRWLFRDALRKMTEELQNLLQQIERQLAQQALFSGDSPRQVGSGTT